MAFDVEARSPAPLEPAREAAAPVRSSSAGTTQAAGTLLAQRLAADDGFEAQARKALAGIPPEGDPDVDARAKAAVAAAIGAQAGRQRAPIQLAAAQSPSATLVSAQSASNAKQFAGNPGAYRSYLRGDIDAWQTRAKAEVTASCSEGLNQVRGALLSGGSAELEQIAKSALDYGEERAIKFNAEGSKSWSPFSSEGAKGDARAKAAREVARAYHDQILMLGRREESPQIEQLMAAAKKELDQFAQTMTQMVDRLHADALADLERAGDDVERIEEVVRKHEGAMQAFSPLLKEVLQRQVDHVKAEAPKALGQSGAVQRALNARSAMPAAIDNAAEEAASHTGSSTLLTVAHLALDVGVVVGVGVFLGPEVIAAVAGAFVLRAGATLIASALIGAGTGAALQMGHNMIDGENLFRGVGGAMGTGAILGGAVGGVELGLAWYWGQGFLRDLASSLTAQIGGVMFVDEMLEHHLANNLDGFTISSAVVIAVAIARAVFARRTGVYGGRQSGGQESGGQESGGQQSGGGSRRSAGAVSGVDEAYSVLGLQPGATSDAIKQARNRLVLKYGTGPDATSPAATEMMKRINAAYELLHPK
jgi:hypothetical protein